MHTLRTRAIIVMAVALAWSAGIASAQSEAPAQGDTSSGVLRPGALYSYGGGTDLSNGFGMDLRYQYFPQRDLGAFVGAFAQGQYELGDAWRFDGGITGGWGVFGIELGVSQRTATATYAGSTGLHIGQSITFGPLSIGARLTIPLVDYVPQNMPVPPSVQGIEGAVTLTLGWGFTIHGQPRHSGCMAHHHMSH
jgi:hypothetical protein